MLKIDREFSGQIPPLTDEEFAQLEENILSDGEVLNPIITWNGIIVDGHNRYRIIEKHPEVPYRVFEKKFSDRNEVLAWICRNQLGRRNLTPQQKRYLIGKQYNAEKMTVPFHGNQYTLAHESGPDQNEQDQNTGLTSEKIARENNTSSAYVRRAARYAAGLDAAENAEPGIRQEILSGEICPSASAVQAVASAVPEKRQELAKHLRDLEIQRRGKPKKELEDFGLAKQVVKNMVSPVSKHKVDENSMLESLRGVADTMIRASKQCFKLFPTLLTEPQYRKRVIEIMQEPKNFILKIESDECEATEKVMFGSEAGYGSGGEGHA